MFEVMELHSEMISKGRNSILAVSHIDVMGETFKLAGSFILYDVRQLDLYVLSYREG